MSKVCEYQGYYIDYDEETGEEDVLKCQLFTDEGEWNEYCYCDEEERNNCMLYKYSKYIKEKDKEIERLTAESTEWESKFYDEAKKNERLHSIINELEKWLKTRNGIKYYPEAFDKLQELKGEDKE